MELPKVDIFVETTYKGPAKKDGAAMWIVEFKKKNGDPVTRQGKIWLEDGTENRATLEAIAQAAGILTKSCSVRVFTRCGHVLGAIKNGWPKRWEKDGWINAKGKPVGNAQEWRRAMDALEPHSHSFQAGPHEYREVMQWELSKEKES